MIIRYLVKTNVKKCFIIMEWRREEEKGFPSWHCSSASDYVVIPGMMVVRTQPQTCCPC